LAKFASSSPSLRSRSSVVYPAFAMLVTGGKISQYHRNAAQRRYIAHDELQ